MEHYFDLETTGLNPETDKIITLQYQPLDKKGNPIGDLVILKEWENSEEEIIKNFVQIFRKWEFIPVGMNLNFDFKFLTNKINKYSEKKIDFTDLTNLPHLDIKSTLVLMNNGNFKGASLNRFTNKSESGAVIPFYYGSKDFEKIIKYVENEAVEFVKFYKDLKLYLTKFGELNETKIFIKQN